MTPLLEVRGLRKHYRVAKRGMIERGQSGVVRAVDDVSFVLQAGQTLGLVGESGCGKTTTARSILDLVPADAGEILLDGQDVRPILAGTDRTAMLAVRRRMQYVFQDPYLSLNPRWTINEALREPLRVHAPQHPRDFPRESRPVGDVHRDVMAPHMVKACVLKGESKRAGLAVVDTVCEPAARGEDARELNEFRREINGADAAAAHRGQIAGRAA